MKKWFSFSILFVFILMVMYACTSKEDNVVQNSSKTQNQKEKTLAEQLDDVELDEYDKLQKFYIDFEDSWNYDTAIGKVKEQGFYFTENSNAYGKSAKVALDNEVAPMTHAKEGDYIEFSYDTESKFEYLTYFNQDIFITLLDYKKGTYFDFRDSTDYQGLYVNTYLDKAGSFTLKYSNENTTEVDYLKLNSKEEQFKYMKLYSDKKR
ncbi:MULTISPECIES: hypothetical protein [unclassified Lysinibacillus]|uniref:hypothetical protein n=1 Tax=unclassified Lysinibacillus TaxID=2636778 RepID=UPI0035D7141D